MCTSSTHTIAMEENIQSLFYFFLRENAESPKEALRTLLEHLRILLEPLQKKPYFSSLILKLIGLKDNLCWKDSMVHTNFKKTLIALLAYQTSHQV